MTLTTTMPTLRARRARLRRASPLHLDFALDAAIPGAAALVCVALFQQGGLEALAGAALGALLGARSSNIVGGALAGLWVGAIFAGFFHGAVIALFGF